MPLKAVQPAQHTPLMKVGTLEPAGTQGNTSIAKSHNKVQYVYTRERRTQHTNIPTYPNLYYREEIDI